MSGGQDEGSSALRYPRRKSGGRHTTENGLHRLSVGGGKLGKGGGALDTSVTLPAREAEVFDIGAGNDGGLFDAAQKDSGLWSPQGWLGNEEPISEIRSTHSERVQSHFKEVKKTLDMAIGSDSDSKDVVVGDHSNFRPKADAPGEDTLLESLYHSPRAGVLGQALSGSESEVGWRPGESLDFTQTQRRSAAREDGGNSNRQQLYCIHATKLRDEHDAGLPVGCPEARNPSVGASNSVTVSSHENSDIDGDDADVSLWSEGWASLQSKTTTRLADSELNEQQSYENEDEGHTELELHVQEPLQQERRMGAWADQSVLAKKDVETQAGRILPTRPFKANIDPRYFDLSFGREWSFNVAEELSPQNAKDPWPSDVKLFQPYEVEQILLPDNANCLAVQAFLKMAKLNFSIEPRSNAEYMSPSGKVPFIQCGTFVISELEPIVSFVSSKGVELTNELDSKQKADMRAYMSLINNILATAELFLTWCDPATYKQVTKPRYGSVFPWPLNHLLCWQKRNAVINRLNLNRWSSKTMDDVLHEVDKCCESLSERLEGKDYFFGDKPTELDALLFGHIFTILTTPLPSNQFAATIRTYPALIDLCKRVEHNYFELPGSS